MSTSYYANSAHALRLGFPFYAGLHIGHAAGGWVFQFRAHTDLGLTTARAWRAFLDRPGVVIHDEYGDEVPLTDFWPYATLPAGPATAERGRVRARQPIGDGYPFWVDQDGFPFGDYEFS